VDSILDAVKWLGFSWEANGTSHYYHASDYFDFMYRAAEYLVEAGLAYIDENLQRFREMRDGKLADGAAVLRAKIDMASPNINLRDPAIYRIRRATHH